MSVCVLQFIFIFDVILLYTCIGADNSTEESKCSSLASSKKNGMVIIFIAHICINYSTPRRYVAGL